jgi:excisionase family DNA binding protein
VIDLLIDRLVDRLAAAVVARLENDRVDRLDEWLDSRQAAEYLGLHRDTLRRLAAARAIPTEQDGRGCKLFFRRSALDEWRRSGGRVRHLASGTR